MFLRNTNSYFTIMKCSLHNFRRVNFLVYLGAIYFGTYCRKSNEMNDEPVPSSWNVAYGLEDTKKLMDVSKKDEYHFQVDNNKWFYQLV